LHSCQLTADEVWAELDKEVQEITQVRFGYWTHLERLQGGS